MSFRFPLLAPVVVLLTGAFLWWGSSLAMAQSSLEQAFDDDLGLIAYADDLRELSSRNQMWEVWLCDRAGDSPLDLQSVTQTLNEHITPYFGWLSAGHYTPTFLPTGRVEVIREPCYLQVGMASSSSVRPLFIVQTSSDYGESGSPGSHTQTEGSIEWTGKPIVTVGKNNLVAPEGEDKPWLGLVAKAIGGALGFPSTTGSRALEPDNPMDIMILGSSDGYTDLGLGTVAVNRYAAGWIDPEDVAIYGGKASVYKLSPVGVDGDQMLVIPSQYRLGTFHALGVRVAQEYDRDIPIEGVEVYRIAQQGPFCRRDSEHICWGRSRRTEPVSLPGEGEGPDTYHVLREGDAINLSGVRVEISKQTGDRFTVVVRTETQLEVPFLVRAANNDDLRLITLANDLQDLALGTPVWEVWTCDVGGPLSLDSSSIAQMFNDQITPYFSWLSRGRYIPSFSSAGSVEGQNWPRCQDQVEKAGWDLSRPAVIVSNNPGTSGRGGPGDYNWYGNSVVWTGGTRIFVDGGAVQATEGRTEPALGTVAHEIGHALAFPHSYGGLSSQEGSTGVYQYDNPMDIMSGGNNDGLYLSTVAANRYVAGWIDPEEVAIYEGGVSVYEMSPLGVGGDQMLVIPIGEAPFRFYTLGVRVAKEYDRDIPVEGVEIYLIDQSRLGCRRFRDFCWGPERRTQPTPPGMKPYATLHVLGVGDVMDLGETQVKIVKRTGDRFTVRVEGMETPPPPPAPDTCGTLPFEGRFCDDDKSVHRANVESLANWEITVGCGENLFCPEGVISRSQMAAFLYRAVSRQYDPPRKSPIDIADVGPDAWFQGFAQWAVSWGVMSLEDGRFYPRRPVTRADMAEMLTAAFPDLFLLDIVEGIFSDTDGLSEFTVEAIESLHRTGVSLGCSGSTLRFCPNRLVTREQMASFFVRTLTQSTN